MKYVDEYRDPRLARRLLENIHRKVTKSWSIMEVCGGQTHTLDPQRHRPTCPGELAVGSRSGCPVCVTPLEQIDRRWPSPHGLV